MTLVFDDEQPTSPKLQYDDESGKSVFGFAKNLGKDVVETAKGVGTLATGFATHPINTTVGVAKSIPSALVNEAKRIGIVGEEGLLNTEPPFIHPIEGAQKFGGALYDKPLTTVLDVLPVAGAVGKAFGIGGKAAETASLADDVARTGAETADDAARATQTATGAIDDMVRGPAGAPPPVAMPDEAAQILKRAPETLPMPPSGAASAAERSVPTGSTFQETVRNLKNATPEVIKKPLDEVSSYLESKYGKAAETPGVVENVGKALEQKARGMRLKEIGGTPGQVRMLRDRFGEGIVNDLADLAEKKGVTKGFFNWQTGNEIKNLMETSGQSIGAVREIAKKRGAVHSIDDLIGKIRNELDPIYMKGSGSSQKGTYLKALQDIRNSGPDVQSMADTISQTNRFIKKNRMTQPLGATSDVMNTAARLNNELIAKFLNPKEAQLYKESLKDFSASKVFDRMYGFTYGRDMAGRSVGGPWSPFNFIKDVGGRKIMEKIFKNVGRKMQSSPGEFSNPLALTDDVLNAIDEALDEVIQQMGKGVPEP